MNSSTDSQITSKIKGSRLKRLRNLTNLSRNELCTKYDIKHGTLKGWEVGVATGLTDRGAKQMLSIFANEGVLYSYEWLMQGTGNEPRIIDKNASTQHLSESYKTTIDQDEKNIIQELQCFRQNHPNSTDWIINDDGMSPFYRDGDYVAGIKYFNDDIRNLDGLDCIIYTDQHETLVRTIRLGTEKNRYNLICHNLETTNKKPIIYNADLIFAAQVIWIRRRLAKEKINTS